MTTSVCYTSSSETKSLVALLQEAVVYVQDDEFDPILYQALAGLHHYIGNHQERLMRRMAAEATSANTGQVDDEEKHHHQKVKYSPTKVSMQEHEDEEAEENQQHDMTASQNIEVTMDENDADLVHVILDDLDDQAAKSIAERDGSEVNASTKDEVLGEQENTEDDSVARAEEKHSSNPTGSPGPTHTKSPNKQEAEEKHQSIEENSDDKQEGQVKSEALKDQNFSKQRPKQQPVKQQEQQRQPQQVKKSNIAVVPPNHSNAPAELLVEQQKKLAAERRRQDVELQRKLARVEQKQRDLQAKRAFLEKEQRKQELVAQSQQTGSVACSNAKESLRQITKQLAAVNTDIQHQRIEVTRIKAEIENRKRQQQHHAADSSVNHGDTGNLIMLQRKRLAEQTRREQTLEAQKIAAAEKRRQNLEEQRRKAREEQKKKDQAKKRRFLEQEQRKQDLIAQAMAGGKATAQKDSALLQKLNIQMSELEAEVERKRSEEAKNEAEVEEQEDSEDFSQEDTKQGSFNRIPGVNEHSQAKKDKVESQASPNFISSHHYSSTKAPDEHQARHSHAAFGSSDQIPASSPQESSSNRHQPSTTVPQDSSPRSESKHGPSDPYSHTHHPPTGSDQKYTKMAEQNDGSEESSRMTDLKRNILLQWALQPPYMQSLRPIDELLRTIHQVYPPAHDLPPHSYFGGWQTISDTDFLAATEGRLDEKNLSKAVRKLRFFLHPDKLPADLTTEHQFMCKLLWDVTNDAWEDYKRAKEELDWMHN